VDDWIGKGTGPRTSLWLEKYGNYDGNNNCPGADKIDSSLVSVPPNRFRMLEIDSVRKLFAGRRCRVNCIAVAVLAKLAAATAAR